MDRHPRMLGAACGIAFGGLLMLSAHTLMCIPLVFLPSGMILGPLEHYTRWRMLQSLWSPVVLNLFFYAAIGYLIGRQIWSVAATNPKFCTHCRYDLTGNVSGRCPECGAVQ